jgi:Fe2+ transport system protein FeoA
VRVVDPQTLEPVADGETGLIVHHDLANVWSCACIRTEDLGVRRGASFELVGRAPGAVVKGCSLQLADMVDA